MMGLAARDPYYLAVLEHELSAHPGAESTVMSTCTRCHAPAANVELQAAGKALSFTDLTRGTSNESVVGRDGVTCSLCHQIQPTNLGTAASFTGGYVVDKSRTIFGPHESPFSMPMQQQVGYTPVASVHTRDSGLCGSCHTVVTHSLDAPGGPAGPDTLEQGPFVEWSVSSFAKPGGKSCQDCHMPTVDDDGAAISTVLSLRPGGNRLSKRSPFGRHTFVGANGLMLRVLANERTWAGFDAPSELLFAEANRADASLRTAARVVVAGTERSGSELIVRMSVDNLTGHKLPTAYPSRRMWLHFRVTDEAGSVVFESGGHRGGRFVDGAGVILDGKDAVTPHRSEISQRSEVQVWEAIMRSEGGEAAANLLDATGYLDDDRVLPDGFDRADSRSTLAHPRRYGERCRLRPCERHRELPGGDAAGTRHDRGGAPLPDDSPLRARASGCPTRARGASLSRHDRAQRHGACRARDPRGPHSVALPSSLHLDGDRRRRGTILRSAPPNRSSCTSTPPTCSAMRASSTRTSASWTWRDARRSSAGAVASSPRR